MDTKGLYGSIETKLSELEKARANQRQAENEVQRLKVELANLNVKLSISEKTNADLLSAAVTSALNAW